MEKTKENSTQILKRIVWGALLCGGVAILLIYFFTNRAIYSIITCCATLVSTAGFVVMIKIIDRILNKGKGQVLFYLSGFLKMAVIAAIFYPVSKISEAAVLFYILGLSMIVISIMIEGGYQLYRSSSHGRT